MKAITRVLLPETSILIEANFVQITILGILHTEDYHVATHCLCLMPIEVRFLTDDIAEFLDKTYSNTANIRRNASELS